MKKLGLGIIGCGGFSLLAREAFEELPGVEVVALADPAPERLGEALGGCPTTTGYPSHDQLLADPRVDVVAIMTPPHLHAPIAREALLAGKHIFLEKPGALTLEEMDSLLDLLASRGLEGSIDFVMRHHPLHRLTAGILRRHLLGPVERASFDNFARDDQLPAHHWFWDKARSGGIWVEHGVHFFDLFRWWLGEPRSIWATASQRPSAPGREDRVLAVLDFNGGTKATIYHGFNRPAPMERQSIRLALQRGYLELTGWIPMHLTLEAWLTEEEFDRLRTPAINGHYPPLELSFQAEELSRAEREYFHFNGVDPSGSAPVLRCRLEAAMAAPRREVYKYCIREGLRDLVATILDPAHRPRVTLGEAREALRLALLAEASARSGHPFTLEMARA